MNKLIGYASIIFMSFSSLVYAKIYKYREKDGTIVLTDSPRKGAVEVQAETNTWTSPAAQRKDVQKIIQESQAIDTSSNDTSTDQKENPNDAKAKQEELKIVSPEEDAYIRNGMGEMIVKTNIEPQEDEAFKATIDGSPSDELYTKSGFIIKNIDRGEHNLIVYLVKKDSGEIIKTSDPVKFFMYRNIIRQNRPVNAQ